jgi:type III restriction enzyme
VRRLIERDAVDYESNAELLFKLSGQMIEHLRSYLKEPEIEAVLRAHAGMLADFIFDQMTQEGHYWETPTTYEPTVTRGFVPVREHYYGKDRNLPLRDFQQPVTPRSDTRKYLFNGFSKCGWDTQRFQSDDERRFAVLIDCREPSVKVWIKPGSGVFQITYAHGQRAASYEPDFLVETASEMLICEVKAANELADPLVQAKAAATRVWIGAANAVAKDTGRKTWRYTLIPHDAVTNAATLDGLVGTYGQTPTSISPLFASQGFDDSPSVSVPSQWRGGLPT